MKTPAQHYVDGAVDTDRATGELSSPAVGPVRVPPPVRGPQALHQVPMTWCGWWGPTAHRVAGGQARQNTRAQSGATMGQVCFTAISSNRACPTVFIALSSV